MKVINLFFGRVSVCEDDVDSFQYRMTLGTYLVCYFSLIMLFLIVK